MFVVDGNGNNVTLKKGSSSAASGSGSGRDSRDDGPGIEEDGHDPHGGSESVPREAEIRRCGQILVTSIACMHPYMQRRKWF